jgi:hypothetical protein
MLHMFPPARKFSLFSKHFRKQLSRNGKIDFREKAAREIFGINHSRDYYVSI